MEDRELKSLLESIKGFCLLNFIEIQRLKKLLCSHLEIGDSISDYNQNLEKYLGRWEQNDILLTKTLTEPEQRQRSQNEKPHQP
jgi:hypothetical protein